MRFRWVAISVAVWLVAGCGGVLHQDGLSAEDSAVVAAVEQASGMSGTFQLQSTTDDRDSSFDVRVSGGNYLLEQRDTAGSASTPNGELMFLRDGRAFSRRSSAWTPQNVQLTTYGNPGAVLATFGAMRGFRRDGTEAVDDLHTTRYVATASDPKKVEKMMGLDQLEAGGATQLGKLLGKYLANTRIKETVWVDDKGQLARATLNLDNTTGHRPGCTLFPGHLAFSVSGMKVDDSVTVTPPKKSEVSPTSAPDPTGSHDATQSGSMASALQACFG